MVQAKKDAKAAQLAAGQFALTQQSKDAARTAFINDQVNYLRDRRDKINDDMVARINATEDIKLKARLKDEGKYQKFLYDRQIKLLELCNKERCGNRVTKPHKSRSLVWIILLLRYVFVNLMDNPCSFFRSKKLARFGVALADVNDGIRSLDDMSALIENIAERPGGVTGQRVKAIEVLNGWSRSSIGWRQHLLRP